ncbi:DNA-binding transcriptional regulator, MarR family [Olsenella sp. KH3B4]|uniref:MarR family winged helix-turn-helix transcriptional regulator n=1 Tax=Olsenella sp. KH3B4 TaxID=1855394 RepID=UPI0008D5306C|nr:MarR family transcriptional regulator [Olsenella sp. KH3B4]SES64172.1 DNA-binding transcriptional regulator, MarR family [Olsenella sp. KH3B4]
MRDLGYFGHFLHLHAGGRSGKQHMLERILDEGGIVGQRELQDTVPISSAALSEVLAKLESEGLVTRTRSQSDKRQLDVSLTQAGQAEAKVCAEKRARFEEEAFSVLSEEERTQLLEVLDRLMGHWQKIEEKDRAVEK